MPTTQAQQTACLAGLGIDFPRWRGYIDDEVPDCPPEVPKEVQAMYKLIRNTRYVRAKLVGTRDLSTSYTGDWVSSEADNFEKGKDSAANDHERSLILRSDVIVNICNQPDAEDRYEKEWVSKLEPEILFRFNRELEELTDRHFCHPCSCYFASGSRILVGRSTKSSNKAKNKEEKDRKETAPDDTAICNKHYNLPTFNISAEIGYDADDNADNEKDAPTKKEKPDFTIGLCMYNRDQEPWKDHSQLFDNNDRLRLLDAVYVNDLLRDNGLRHPYSPQKQKNKEPIPKNLTQADPGFPFALWEAKRSIGSRGEALRQTARKAATILRYQKKLFQATEIPEVPLLWIFVNAGPDWEVHGCTMDEKNQRKGRNLTKIVKLWYGNLEEHNAAFQLLYIIEIISVWAEHVYKPAICECIRRLDAKVNGRPFPELSSTLWGARKPVCDTEYPRLFQIRRWQNEYSEIPNSTVAYAHAAQKIIVAENTKKIQETVGNLYYQVDKETAAFPDAEMRQHPIVGSDNGMKRENSVMSDTLPTEVRPTTPETGSDQVSTSIQRTRRSQASPSVGRTRQSRASLSVQKNSPARSRIDALRTVSVRDTRQKSQLAPPMPYNNKRVFPQLYDYVWFSERDPGDSDLLAIRISPLGKVFEPMVIFHDHDWTAPHFVDLVQEELLRSSPDVIREFTKDASGVGYLYNSIIYNKHFTEPRVQYVVVVPLDPRMLRSGPSQLFKNDETFEPFRLLELKLKISSLINTVYLEHAKQCVCNSPKNGRDDVLVPCDNVKCEVQWFHRQCTDWTRKEAADWLCAQCRLDPDRLQVHSNLPSSLADQLHERSVDRIHRTRSIARAWAKHEWPAEDVMLDLIDKIAKYMVLSSTDFTFDSDQIPLIPQGCWALPKEHGGSVKRVKLRTIVSASQIEDGMTAETKARPSVNTNRKTLSFLRRKTLALRRWPKA